MRKCNSCGDVYKDKDCSCNKCNNLCNTISEKCGRCDTDNLVDSINVIYTAGDLEPIGAKTCMSVEEIIQRINEYLLNLRFKDSLDFNFLGTNIGGAAEVYNENSTETAEFRTLEGNQGVKVEQFPNLIKISLDKAWLNENLNSVTLLDISTGISLLKINTTNDYSIKGIKSVDDSIILGNTPTDATIKVSEEWVKSLIPEIPEVNNITLTNVGQGSQIVESFNSNNYNIRSLRPGDISMIINTNSSGEILFKVSEDWVRSLIPEVDVPDQVSINSLGSGLTVLKNLPVGYGIRSLKSMDTSITSQILSDDTIGMSVNEQWVKDLIDQNTPDVDISSVGSGVEIYNDLGHGQHGISSLKSDTLGITKLSDKTIKIELESLVGLNAMKEYHVDVNFVPTPSQPANGSIISPFTSFDAARDAMIGTGTRVNPQNKDVMIVLHSDVNTATNPMVNTMTIKFMDGVTFTYRGEDHYVFDMSTLLNQAPRGSRNEILNDIYVAITGDGVIRRTIGSGTGVVNAVGQDGNISNPLVNDKQVVLFLGVLEGDRIRIEETITDNSSWTNNTADINDVPYTNSFGGDFKYSTTASVEGSLVHVAGASGKRTKPCLVSKGILELETISNKAIIIYDRSKSIFDRIRFGANFRYIPVTEPNTWSSFTRGYYKPISGSCFMEIKGGYLEFDEIGATSYTPLQFVSRDSFIKITGSNFEINKGVIRYSSNVLFNKFIHYLHGGASVINLNNKGDKGFIDCKMLKVVESPGTCNLLIRNMSISKTRSWGGSNITYSTQGTASSYNERTMITDVPIYKSHTEAEQSGLTKGTIFKIQNTDFLGIVP